MFLMWSSAGSNLYYFVMHPDLPLLWCYTWAVCASAGYTWCFGRILVHLCAIRCRTSNYRKICIPLSVSLWNDLGYHAFNGIGLTGFKNRENAFLLARLLAPFFVSYWCPFLFFHSMGWYCGAEDFGLIGC